MPNQPATPLRSLRISDELWGAVKAKAEQDGRTVSEVVRELLAGYLMPEPAAQP